MILTVLRSYCVMLYPYIAYDCMYFNDSNSKWFSLQPRGPLNTSWPTLFLLYIYIYTFIKQWFRNHTWYIILHTHQKCSLLTILRRMTMSPQIHRPCGWLLRFGEGYFEGLWYCSDCWDSWQDAPAEMTTISPWPLEAGVSTKGWCGWPVRPWVN